MKRAAWTIVEYAAFAVWLPAAALLDVTERVMDRAYRGQGISW